MPPLGVVGWRYDFRGTQVDGLPLGKSGYVGYVPFTHSQALKPGDAWRMTVDSKIVYIGFAAEGYDPKRHAETEESTAYVVLGTGNTRINSGIGTDGHQHYYSCHLKKEIPKVRPFDVALRCEAVSNVPQIQFNDDGVWHDFAPGRVALKSSGLISPFLSMTGPVYPSRHVQSVGQPSTDWPSKCKFGQLYLTFTGSSVQAHASAGPSVQ